MADEIAPALTAEEWAAVNGGEALTFVSAPELTVHDAGDGIKFVVEGRPIEESLVGEIDSWDATGLSQLIAVLLNALPAGHPLKITREDVAILQGEAEWIALHYPPNTPMALDRIAAKLAALLPPE